LRWKKPQLLETVSDKYVHGADLISQLERESVAQDSGKRRQIAAHAEIHAAQIPCELLRYIDISSYIDIFILMYTPGTRPRERP